MLIGKIARVEPRLETPLDWPRRCHKKSGAC